MAALSAETVGVVTAAVRTEERNAVLEAVEALDDLDREVVIMRGIEQVPNEMAARALGMNPNTVAHRFRRALKKLKDRLPHSIFADLPDE